MTKHGRNPISRATSRYAFSGDVDYASAITFPWNTSFTSRQGGRQTGRVFGLSGLSILPHAATLLALCDHGALLTANLTFDHSTLALSSVSWDSFWPLVKTNDEGRIDSEAVSISGVTNEVFVASEDLSSILKVAGPETWSNQSKLTATTAANISVDLQDDERGLESMVVLDAAQTPASVFVSCPEGPVYEDDFAVRRLIEQQASTGDVPFQAVVILPKTNPPLYATELVQLGGSGGLSAGAQFLLLTRGWNEAKGCLIRIYLLDTAKADNVVGCQAVTVNAGDVVASCAGSNSSVQAVDMEMLLDWSLENPLNGNITVDNYEGMTIIPPAAFGATSSDALGGLMLLLVNDNNDDPAQVPLHGATQFVSLRLPFAEYENRQLRGARA